MASQDEIQKAVEDALAAQQLKKDQAYVKTLIPAAWIVIGLAVIWIIFKYYDARLAMVIGLFGGIGLIIWLLVKSSNTHP